MIFGVLTHTKWGILLREKMIKFYKQLSLKFCKECEKVLSIGEFSKPKNRKNLRNFCNTCFKMKKSRSDKKYYNSNKKIISEKQKIYNEINIEKISEHRLKFRQENKERLKHNAKEHYKKNKDKAKMRAKRYVYKNYQKNKLKKMEWNLKNKEKIKEQRKQNIEKNRQRINERYKYDSVFRTKARLRSSLRKAFKNYSKNGKIAKASEYGIDYQRIIEHLGPCPGNEIANWHLDHIFPISAFNFDDNFHVWACFNEDNLQWLEKEYNLLKSDDYNYLEFKKYLINKFEEFKLLEEK